MAFKRIERNYEFNHSKYVCESTDTKPTEGIEYGDMCIEIDTATIFYFDGSTWKQQ